MLAKALQSAVRFVAEGDRHRCSGVGGIPFRLAPDIFLKLAAL
jgi:hypothetical protein